MQGILKNKIVDLIRKNVRERHPEDLKLYDEQPTRLRKHFGIASRYVNKWSFDPAHEYEKNEFWNVCNTCFQKLKEPLRRVYFVREVENMSSEKICKDLSISPNNLCINIH